MNILALILVMLGAGVVAGLSERLHAAAPKWISLATFIATLAWVGAFIAGDGYANQYIPWIPRFGINIVLSMDGLSQLLVALTLFLGIVA